MVFRIITMHTSQNTLKNKFENNSK